MTQSKLIILLFGSFKIWGSSSVSPGPSESVSPQAKRLSQATSDAQSAESVLGESEDGISSIVSQILNTLHGRDPSLDSTRAGTSGLRRTSETASSQTSSGTREQMHSNTSNS